MTKKQIIYYCYFKIVGSSLGVLIYDKLTRYIRFNFTLSLGNQTMMDTNRVNERTPL